MIGMEAVARHVPILVWQLELRDKSLAVTTLGGARHSDVRGDGQDEDRPGTDRSDGLGVRIWHKTAPEDGRVTKAIARSTQSPDDA